MTERGGSPEWYTPKPMLAHEKPKEIPIDRYGDLGWIAEPKIDGFRVTARRKDGAVMAWTRPGPGRPFGLQRQLPEHVAAAVCQLPDGVYDGEIAIASGASWHALSDAYVDQQRFFLFDILETCGESVMKLRWKDRRQVLEMACSASVGQGVVLVPVVPATQEQYDIELEAGGEGLMLKTTTSIYRPGARTKEWLKVKPTELAVLVIVGYVPAIRGPHATLVLHDKDRNEITISTPTPVLLMADKNPKSLLGRPVVIKYQMRTPPNPPRCPTGSYRHPRMHTEKTLAMWRRK